MTINRVKQVLQKITDFCKVKAILVTYKLSLSSLWLGNETLFVKLDSPS